MTRANVCSREPSAGAVFSDISFFGIRLDIFAADLHNRAP